MARGLRSLLPLVSKDIRREQRLMNDLASLHISSDRHQQAGRFARHDRVAMCLLRKDIETFMPIRREVRIARNRRMLRWVFLFCVVWWLAGRWLI